MMRFFTLLMAITLCGSLSAQTVIWGGAGDPNGEFDGGLNDWTAVAVSPNENALWYWNEDGIAGDGAYAGTDPQPIASASVDNGSVSFDSDFLDNAGTPGNFGNGDAAAPQRAELISPAFSTMGYDDVSIMWTQYMRRWQSTFFIEISDDGGENWTSVAIDKNNDLPVNGRTSTGDIVLMDVSEFMANKESVQFKFVFEANYYFWTIDDVAVIETPDHNLAALHMRYPFNAASTPLSCLNADTLNFALTFTNDGKADQSNTLSTVQILDENLDAVYEFTKEYGPVAVGDTVTVTFDDVVLPEDISLTEGTYNVVYNVDPLDGDEFLPNNNGLVESVAISADVYDISQGASTGYVYSSGAFSSAIVIRTGDLADNMEYFIKSTTVTGVDQNQDSIVNAFGEVALMKLINDESESLSGLDAATTYGANGDHENLEPVGYGFFSAEKHDNYENITVPILNVEDDEEGLVLEENSIYLLGLNWNIENNGGFVFSGANTSISYDAFVSLVYLPDNGWFNNGDEVNWYMPTVLETRMVDNTEIIELDENAVSVYPNPAIQSTFVELSFEQATDASIILRDALGGYITTKTVTGVTNTKVDFDLTGLTAGTYTFEITTSNGERTVKSFVKVQ